MSEKITALVPCRAGSQRIPNKNTKLFAGSSLLNIKLDQLLQVEKIEQIIVSTDDEKVITICKEYNNEKISVHKRDSYYASSECTNDEFIKYFADTLNFEGHLLWTHVTSPFCNTATYERAISQYLKFTDEYDSLVSVELLRGYIWGKDNKPLNYDMSKMGRWPKTQDIDPYFLLNSAIFLLPRQLMKEKQDRVGDKPYFFPMNQLESFDIDWPEDFVLGEKIWSAFNNK